MNLYKPWGYNFHPNIAGLNEKKKKKEEVKEGGGRSRVNHSQEHWHQIYT